MSQENVEIVRRGYETFIASGEILPENLAPEFVLDMSTFRDWPEQQQYSGAEGMRAFLADWLEPWHDYEFEVEELRDAGDRVAATVVQRARSKATGVPVDMRLGHLWTFGGQKLIRLAGYATPDEALEAAGLSE